MSIAAARARWSRQFRTRNDPQATIKHPKNNGSRLQENDNVASARE